MKKFDKNHTHRLILMIVVVIVIVNLRFTGKSDAAMIERVGLGSNNFGRKRRCTGIFTSANFGQKRGYRHLGAMVWRQRLSSDRRRKHWKVDAQILFGGGGSESLKRKFKAG